jgi:two-component system KDP operon response regulator KdpE
VKLAAFDAGADDYVTKPFSTAELSPASPPSSADMGPMKPRISKWAACPRSQHTMSHALNGKPLKLTPTEYALLAQLVKHAGKVVTLKHLLRAVWGPQAEEQTHYLRVYANHLRKKLEGSSLEIKNEPGIGYRLVEER